MVAYQHPSELNPFQRYRQASSILRGTSRASNVGWYQSPLDLDFQLHLRLDGVRAESWIHQPASGKWSPGPAFEEDFLLDPAKVPAFAAEAVARAQKAGAKALGIILHIADEFATTELKPELDNPGALNELRVAIANEPDSVLDDSSLSAEEHSWRLIPYPATGSESIATAITLSRGADDFLEALRQYGTARNFPVTTLAVSAPLVALLALPELKAGPCERSFITVLTYSRFTVLGFFNEHGDLRLLRTLQHRGQRRPSNLRHAASTTAAALEMSQPEIVILPLAGESDPQMVADLRIVFDSSEIREFDWNRTAFHDASAPGASPEMLIAATLSQAPDTPLAASHTFSTLRSEGWATQDFLPLSATVAETYPNRGEMKLLSIARVARVALALVAMLALAWAALGVINIIRKPEWAFNEQESQAVTGRLAVLNAESQRLSHWDNLLEDRSKGWTSMEMLARLFPDRGGFLIKTYNHSASPQPAPGQTQTGFVKEWKITGMAREEALQRLADLNTREGISAALTEVAQVTGNSAYRTDLPSRSVVVNVRTVENNSFKPVAPEEMHVSDESTYPFLFDLTITQRFESADPMALNSAKAP